MKRKSIGTRTKAHRPDGPHRPHTFTSRGRAILDLYFALGIAVRSPQNSHLLPYDERMKRSYMKNRKPRRKPEKQESGASPDDKNQPED